MMECITLNGVFYRTWFGPCPRVEEELAKAKAGVDGFSYHQVADGEYPEGEEASHFDLSTGTRIVELPKKEVPEEELWKQEKYILEARCDELDQASDRAMRAIICGTATDSDKAFLIGIETDIQVKRERIRELNSMLKEKEIKA